MRKFSEAELALIWDRRSQGVGMRTVARELGRGSWVGAVDGGELRRGPASPSGPFLSASDSRGAGGDLTWCCFW